MTAGTGKRGKRGHGTIRERKPGYWEVRFPVGGGKQMSRYLKGTREEAEALRAELVAADICSVEFAELMLNEGPAHRLDAVGDRRIPTSTLREWLLDTGRDLECEGCGITKWLGRPAPLDIDHVNGNCCDNRLDNLRFLCPNCHRLTRTYGRGTRPPKPIPKMVWTQRKSRAS